ncbi:MAG: AarF/UbiB family protein, partial [Kiloniellales bacterium]|nr:AarF/UbiB family protein [Kiloniellales bacterium]
MLRPIRTVLRLLAIARTLARYDALAALEVLKVAPGLLWVARLGSRRDVEGRPGQKLARALNELGPTFIKLGQFLSTRADLLGEQLAADLSELQDRLPPFDSAAARATVERELGRPIEALFARFEERPVSAASIAQVHLAVVKKTPRETPGQTVSGPLSGPAAAAPAAEPSSEPAAAPGDAPPG